MEEENEVGKEEEKEEEEEEEEEGKEGGKQTELEMEEEVEGGGSGASPKSNNYILHILSYSALSFTVEPLYSGHHRGIKLWPL